MKRPTKHEPVVREDIDGNYYAVCGCGEGSGVHHYPKIFRWKAADWCIAHLEQVNHALAVLHRANGSLKIERDHAAKMLDDPDTPANDRVMWKILLDGAEARLRDAGRPDPETEGLW